MIFHKAGIEGRPALLWEISEPSERPQSCPGRAVGRGVVERWTTGSYFVSKHGTLLS